VAFQASSLNAVIENLESLGIEYRSTHIPEIRMTQLFFKDPAGTGIEVNFLEGVPSADE
jgi:catechol-2,3-dioxygenase